MDPDRTLDAISAICAIRAPLTEPHWKALGELLAALRLWIGTGGPPPDWTLHHAATIVYNVYDADLTARPVTPRSST